MKRTKKTDKKGWLRRLELIGKLILNWRFLTCFLIAWMVTNGWSYLMFGIGMYFDIKPLILISSAYLAFLWLPFSPEKIVTLAIGLFLVRLLFPKHRDAIKSQWEELSGRRKK